MYLDAVARIGCMTMVLNSLIFTLKWQPCLKMVSKKVTSYASEISTTHFRIPDMSMKLKIIVAGNPSIWDSTSVFAGLAHGLWCKNIKLTSEQMSGCWVTMEWCFTDSDVFSVPPNYACADPGDFCWWFLIHLAPLYTYDEFGVSQKQVSPFPVIAIGICSVSYKIWTDLFRYFHFLNI